MRSTISDGACTTGRGSGWRAFATGDRVELTRVDLAWVFPRTGLDGWGDTALPLPFVHRRQTQDSIPTSCICSLVDLLMRRDPCLKQEADDTLVQKVEVKRSRERLMRELTMVP